MCRQDKGLLPISLVCCVWGFFFLGYTCCYFSLRILSGCRHPKTKKIPRYLEKPGACFSYDVYNYTGMPFSNRYAWYSTGLRKDLQLVLKLAGKKKVILGVTSSGLPGKLGTVVE